MTEKTTIVPPLPDTASLPDGAEIATPEVGLDHDAVVALEDKAHALVGATTQKATDLAAADAARAAALAVEVAKKASELADTVAARAVILSGTTQNKAVQIAVAQALRDQHVDHILEGHGRRLDTIEASGAAIEKTLDIHSNILIRIETKVDQSIQAAKDAATKRLSSRTFAVTTIGVCVTMASATIAALGATGNL